MRTVVASTSPAGPSRTAYTPPRRTLPPRRGRPAGAPWACRSHHRSKTRNRLIQAIPLSDLKVPNADDKQARESRRQGLRTREALLGAPLRFRGAAAPLAPRGLPPPDRSRWSLQGMIQTYRSDLAWELPRGLYEGHEPGIPPGPQPEIEPSAAARIVSACFERTYDARHGTHDSPSGCSGPPESSLSERDCHCVSSH